MREKHTLVSLISICSFCCSCLVVSLASSVGYGRHTAADLGFGLVEAGDTGARQAAQPYTRAFPPGAGVDGRPAHTGHIPLGAAGPLEARLSLGGKYRGEAGGACPA